MKRFHCTNCGNELFFDSLACVRCGNAVAYEPRRFAMLSAPHGTPWSDAGASFRVCANAQLARCNWLVPADADGAWCEACAHNRTVPDLADPTAVARWQRLELAKRTLIYSLMRWGLPRPTEPDGSVALTFSFLADTTQPDGTIVPVMTGHDSGHITIAIAEGDDAERERRRTSMGEPYRTLVGHFRHEVGHYYWDRLVRDGGRLKECRELFGDDRADYGAALKRHYEEGPPADWPARFISSYATAHAWEDFAETFAHYLHMVDALETAGAFDLRVAPVGGLAAPRVAFDPYSEGTIDDLLAAWVPLTVALNAMNRSMGQPDLYPFVLSKPVEEKLGFVHDLLRQGVGHTVRTAPRAAGART